MSCTSITSFAARARAAINHMASDDAMDVEAAGAPLAGMEVESSTESLRSVGADDTGVVVVHEARQMVVAFLKEHLADEVAPDNSRVVILDADLSLLSAFHSLLDHGIRAAPVLSTPEQAFIGLLTVTDLIRALREPFPVGDLSGHIAGKTVRQWLTSPPREMYVADAEQTLLEACLTMRDRRVHRLPVIFRKRKVLYTLEHWRVLQFVYQHLVDRDDPRSEMLFGFTLAQLCIGTYAGLKTVEESTPLKEVLDLLLVEELSAVPIVDAEGKLRDVYSRTDVTALLVGKISAATLDMPVAEALAPVRPRGFRLATCRTMDTLGTVFNIFERARKQRLYVINQHGVLEGVLSLRDLLVYFLHGVGV